MEVCLAAFIQVMNGLFYVPNLPAGMKACTCNELGGAGMDVPHFGSKTSSRCMGLDPEPCQSSGLAWLSKTVFLGWFEHSFLSLCPLCPMHASPMHRQNCPDRCWSESIWGLLTLTWKTMWRCLWCCRCAKTNVNTNAYHSFAAQTICPMLCASSVIIVSSVPVSQAYNVLPAVHDCQLLCRMVQALFPQDMIK